MNLYGQRAMRHWEQFRATSYAQLEDPRAFFTELGEEIATQIDLICQTMESRERTALNQMDYLPRVGRLNAIKSQAEEVVTTELVYSLPLENEISSLTPEQLEAKAAALGGTIIDGRLRPADPTHPWRVIHANWTEQQIVAEPYEQQSARWDLMSWFSEDDARSEMEDQLEDLVLANE